MISYPAARLTILEYLDKTGIDVDLLEEETMHLDFGWVFFYQSREYLRSGNLSYALAGNAPIIIDRQTGQINETGTAYSVDYYIEKYKAKSGLS